MFKMTALLCAAIYVGFAVWGQPGDAFVEDETDDAPLVAIQAAQAAQSYDYPTILPSDERLAAVTRSLPAAPDPSIIAASAPNPGFDDPGRLGEPVVVTLMHDSLLDEPVGTTIEASTGVETASLAAADRPDGGALLRVTGSRVNMRAGPSVGNAVVDSLAEGALAEALSEPVDGWIEIRDVSTGLTGFMSANFLEPT